MASGDGAEEEGGDVSVSTASLQVNLKSAGITNEKKELANQHFKNVFLPAIIGSSFGAIGQHFLGNGVINVANSFSPFLQIVSELLVIVAMTIPVIIILGLFHLQESKFLDYIGGAFTLLIPVVILSAMFPACLLPFAIMVWFYTSMSWSRYNLPDYRLGMWGGMGSLVGALVGAMAYTMLS